MNLALALLVVLLALVAAVVASVQPVVSIGVIIWVYLRNLLRGPIKKEPFSKKKAR